MENLIIRNHQRNDAVGILVEGACDHIRIDDCEIYNINFSSVPNAPVNSGTNAHAIAVYGDNANHTITNLEILDNDIHDCRLGYSEALVVNGNIDGFVIIDNEVYDVTNIGIDIIGHEGTCDDPTKDQARNGIISKNVTYNCLSPYATAAGIYVDGGKNLIIEQNLVYNNQWGIEIGCENLGKSTDNIIVRNNIIYGNTTAGLAIGGYDYPSGSGKVSNVKILNNTLYDNDTEDGYTGELYMSYNENILIANNIFHSASSTGYILSTEDLIPSVSVSISNNNWYSSLGSGMEEYYYYGQDFQGIDQISNANSEFLNNLSANPNFKSITNANFKLEAGSEMINRGVADNNAGSEDFDGNNRIVGTIDIGAYEYDATLALQEIWVGELDIYPTLASNVVYIDSKEEMAVWIYNSLGIVMQELSQVNGFTELDVSNYPHGLYVIKSERGINGVFIKQ